MYNFIHHSAFRVFDKYYLEINFNILTKKRFIHDIIKYRELAKFK